jgi:tetratricopeptide (TPR) repeat protein
MKTTMRTLFIFSLLFNILHAKPLHVTFELVQSTPQYVDILQKKAFEYRRLGLKCYLVNKKNEKLFLRCNDVNNTKAFNNTLKILKKANLEYTIIDLDKRKTYKRDPNAPAIPFYAGYNAYNQKKYKEAEKIFLPYYKKEPNFEHSYALALVSMKRYKYAKCRKYLEPFIKTDKKAKKLYYDSIVTQFYANLHSKNYDKANSLIDSYSKQFPALKNLKSEILAAKTGEAIKKGDFTKARELSDNSTSIKSKKIKFEIDYQEALLFQKNREYKKAVNLMLAYINTQRKARALIENITLSRAGEYIQKKEYSRAKKILYPLIKNSKKAKKLYLKVQYQELMDEAWENIEKNPSLSMKLFESANTIKKTNNNLEGRMYAAYNLKYYSKSSKLSQKLYYYTKSQKAVQVAFNSAMNMNDYKRAGFWYDRLKNRENVVDPYKISYLNEIDAEIKNSSYQEALQMIQYLDAMYPNDIYILQKRIEILMHLKAYDDVEKTIAEIFKIDKNNRYAISTRAYLLSQQNRCEDALKYYHRLNAIEHYEKEPFLSCSAKMEILNHNYNKAVTLINAIDSNKTKSALYLNVAESYEFDKNKDALLAYKKSLELNPDDFNIQLLYLYRIKDSKEDYLFETTMKDALKHFKQKDQQRKLISLKHEYQRARLLSYYDNKRFGLCYRYANVVLVDQKSKGLDRIHAWCAYYTKHYDVSQKLFAKLNLDYGQNVDDTYAYALSAYQNSNNESAIKALNRIDSNLNEQQSFNIARLYMDLKEQDRAKEILYTLPHSQERDELLTQINKSYKTVNRQDLLAGGLSYTRRSGLEGLHWFEKYSLPLDVDIYQNRSIHWYGDADILYLYDGFLSDNNGSYLDFGLGEANRRDDIASDIGFQPKIGVEIPHLKLEIGSTPIGAKISPEFTWLARLSGSKDEWGAHISFVQKSLDETMVSFVGERASKDNLEVNWGRVLKQGFEAGVSYDSDITLSLDLGYYPNIHGLNVMDNSEFKLVSSAVYHSSIEELSFADFGILFVYDSFDKNSDLFTYGHGGYFSPQEFWLGNFIVSVGDTFGSKFYYKANGSLGFEGYIVDDVDKYPLHDINDAELTGTVAGYRSGGLTYKASLGIGYKLTKNVDIVSAASFESIYSYEMLQAGFSLVYFFDNKHKGSLHNFDASHQIEKTLK